MVSLATFAAMRDQFVYFGILHAIAASSLLGLAFLRLPVAVTVACAMAVWAVAFLFKGAVFDTVWLSWTGLSGTVRPSMDLVALVPWFAPALLGIAVGKWADRAGLLRPSPTTPIECGLAWPGRHSLVIYLLHQPVLMALIWGWLRWA